MLSLFRTLTKHLHDHLPPSAGHGPVQKPMSSRPLRQDEPTDSWQRCISPGLVRDTLYVWHVDVERRLEPVGDYTAKEAGGITHITKISSKP